MTDSDRSLWDLWLMLWRAKESADSEALMPTLPPEWQDTLPMARPSEDEG